MYMFMHITFSVHVHVYMYIINSINSEERGEGAFTRAGEFAGAVTV